MTPEDKAQIARVKWLLTLTGQACQVSGFNQKVIDILAPAMVDVMSAEGVFLAYQSSVDRAVQELEREAT